MEEQIVRHIHENKDGRPDSIEFAASVKGGPGLKIYFNANASAEETTGIIDRAFEARKYATTKYAAEQGTPQ